jgi:hypothetical protein
MSNQKLGPDNWLHILSHALSLYQADGGLLAIGQQPSGLTITLMGVSAEDGRLHQNFKRLISRGGQQGNGQTS